MGTCYTVFLQDDFDWSYLNRTKETTLKEFAQEFKVTKLGEWSGWAVFDFEKTPPYIDYVKTRILNYCDACYYTADTEAGLLKKLV